ncbi:MAG: T9SS type A sorting domain-containing protein, partial [Saprospiraceae bacterium]
SEWDLSKQLAPQQLGVFKTFNTTATNELERKVQADLSPNPVVAGLNAQIVFQSEEPVSAMLFLSDMNGRKVYNQAIQLGSGENLIDVPTDKLSAGLYFVSIQNESGSIVKRLAVIN